MRLTGALTVAQPPEATLFGNRPLKMGSRQNEAAGGLQSWCPRTKGNLGQAHGEREECSHAPSPEAGSTPPGACGEHGPAHSCSSDSQPPDSEGVRFRGSACSFLRGVLFHRPEKTHARGHLPKTTRSRGGVGRRHRGPSVLTPPGHRPGTMTWGSRPSATSLYPCLVLRGHLHRSW